MAVVKINAIEVADGAGPELERRFAARMAAVEEAPGFQGFELLRPVAGQNRYFVYTRWDSEEAFEAWANGPARQAHANGHANGNGQPVANGASMLEFEVVQRAQPRVPA
jgi:heme-degrading monooxygenase HmoA